MHRLALVFGRPVAELNLDADEFIHWIAFERLNPFPDTRIEFMLAQLTAIVVRMASGGKPKPGDYMLTEIMAKQERESMSFEGQARASLIAVFGPPPTKRGNG